MHGQLLALLRALNLGAMASASRIRRCALPVRIAFSWLREPFSPVFELNDPHHASKTFGRCQGARDVNLLRVPSATGGHNEYPLKRTIYEIRSKRHPSTVLNRF
jgi:hypothetical protein